MLSKKVWDDSHSIFSSHSSSTLSSLASDRVGGGTELVLCVGMGLKYPELDDEKLPIDCHSKHSTSRQADNLIIEVPVVW